jgi:hypothetical protein
MLVAPLVVSAPLQPVSRSRLRRIRSVSDRDPRHEMSTLVQHALLAWMIVGLLVLVCVPAARGDGALGATLPFWLVIAPALDLIWLSRRRVLRMVCVGRTPLRATTRQARRMRRAA